MTDLYQIIAEGQTAFSEREKTKEEISKLQSQKKKLLADAKTKVPSPPTPKPTDNKAKAEKEVEKNISLRKAKKEKFLGFLRVFLAIAISLVQTVPLVLLIERSDSAMLYVDLVLFPVLFFFALFALYHEKYWLSAFLASIEIALFNVESPEKLFLGILIIAVSGGLMVLISVFVCGREPVVKPNKAEQEQLNAASALDKKNREENALAAKKHSEAVAAKQKENLAEITPKVTLIDKTTANLQKLIDDCSRQIEELGLSDDVLGEENSKQLCAIVDEEKPETVKELILYFRNDRKLERIRQIESENRVAMLAHEIKMDLYARERQQALNMYRYEADMLAFSLSNSEMQLEKAVREANAEAEQAEALLQNH